MKRPSGLLYGPDDALPPAALGLNAVQHVALISLNFVYPLLIFRLAGAGDVQVAGLLSSGMVVLALATVLQVGRFGPLGSGVMCPSTFTATYVGPSLLAAKTGGLSLIFGMTAFAGLLQTALAPLLQRLRPFFPTEVSGLVILLVGMGAAVAGLRPVLGEDATMPTAAEWSVGALTLASMVIANVWGRGSVRMLCALVGLTVGYATSAIAGLLGAEQVAQIVAAPWFGIPAFFPVTPSFDIGLALPFAIAAMAASMKAIGTITVCQRMVDADWVRPDMRSATRGVLADGASTLLAGLAGAVGTNSSTPSVGLASATGVASRHVGYATAGLFLLLGLTPKLAALFAVMPRPVMVAALLFAICFIIVNGLQVISSRLLDARRTLVIGLAIIAGVAADVYPLIARHGPDAMSPILGSSVVLGTAVALTLNLLFRLGVRRRVRLEVSHGAHDARAIDGFFHTQGGAWGARPEVVARAAFAVNQFAEAAADHVWSEGLLAISASFDEYSLKIDLDYRGAPMAFPAVRPSEREIREDDAALARLAGFMLRHNADRVRSRGKDGMASVRFHFDH